LYWRVIREKRNKGKCTGREKIGFEGNAERVET
jgi:hypothetical protein